MRIMFVIPSMNNGGSERVVANLCNYWCKDNDVRIVAIASKKSFYKLDKRVELCGQELEIKRKNIFTTLGCYAKYFLKSLRFLKKNIQEFNPDCIISFLAETDILTFLATRKTRDIIKIFSERNDPTKRGALRRMVLNKIYKTADLFVCQSKKVYDYYDFISKNKKIIIPNPLNVKNLPASVDEQNHNIVAVGRLCRQKNFQLLIDSYILSIDKLPKDCNLIIYGDGPMKKEIENRIKEKGMIGRIVLAGKSDEVLKKIRGCALFVMSSDYEGFPNALLEAMAVGLPVISTDFFTGVARDLIGRENGIVVPVGDVSKMSEAIVDIMSDKKDMVIMRKRNSLVRKKYDIDKIAPMWTESISLILTKERCENGSFC